MPYLVFVAHLLPNLRTENDQLNLNDFDFFSNYCAFLFLDYSFVNENSHLSKMKTMSLDAGNCSGTARHNTISCRALCLSTAPWQTINSS